MGMDILERFIVIEGPDGSGTTTQTAMLHKSISDRGLKAASTFEPTDAVIGRLIRAILAREQKVTDGALALLYAADRDDHLFNEEHGIIRQLEENDIVISDRYLFSSLVYQGIQIPYQQVEAYNSFFPLPEILIYIDTPVDECIRRIRSRGGVEDIFEVEAFQHQVYQRYDDLIASLPIEVQQIRVDGTQSAEQIQEEILEGLSQIMNIASP
jgi:dTMP kinase